jgi:hypothetical protein
MNPDPMVQVARDAARKLDADMCVVIFVSTKNDHMGYVSYGSSAKLCAETRKMADHCYEAARGWFEQ